MDSTKIVSVEWGRLEGRRPRAAGSNARLGDHGVTVGVPLARITTGDGASGFGVCRAGQEAATALLGQPFDAVFAGGTREPWRVFDQALWDLSGQRAGKPVYALLSDGPAPTVRCYDTSLYFDDLHIASEEEAAALIASEAREGYARGHRAFKIKVGRGARHMPLEEGTLRDLAVIRAVRDAVGPEAPIMIDANNGWNLNLTKRVLAETADCNLYWMEEAFHEDPVLYRDLRDWMTREGLEVLIADGEGQASPTLLDWARDGLVDVIQYDIFSHLGHGFTAWLETGKRLEPWPTVHSAPHHYGGHLGNYVSGHLAGVLPRFTFVEWDEAETPGIDASGYVLRDGYVSLPATPGFGLNLDEAVFQKAVTENGGAVTV